VKIVHAGGVAAGDLGPSSTPGVDSAAERTGRPSPLGGPTFPLNLTAAYDWPSHSGVCVVLSFTLAALFFIGIRLGIAGTVIRDRAIAVLGETVIGPASRSLR
jgi:hypothetical protein